MAKLKYDISKAVDTVVRAASRKRTNMASLSKVNKFKAVTKVACSPFELSNLYAYRPMSSWYGMTSIFHASDFSGSLSISWMGRIMYPKIYKMPSLRLFESDAIYREHIDCNGDRCPL